MNGNYLKTIIIKCSVRRQIKINNEKRKSTPTNKPSHFNLKVDERLVNTEPKGELELCMTSLFSIQFKWFLFFCTKMLREFSKQNVEKTSKQWQMKRHTIDSSRALIKSIWFYCVMKMEINNRTKTNRPHSMNTQRERNREPKSGGGESVWYNQQCRQVQPFTFVRTMWNNFVNESSHHQSSMTQFSNWNSIDDDAQSKRFIYRFV